MVDGQDGFDDEPEVEDDRDSLHVLPLSFIPLVTKSLGTARMIKNVRMEGVIEMFSDSRAGSGQESPFDLKKIFGWDDGDPPPDQQIIESLAALNSYDVYSLRITLRHLDIPFSDFQSLQLSDTKKDQLTSYMRSFTLPLIQQVYGATDTQIRSIDELLALFQRPNRKDALENLQKMADRLRIQLMEVPRFLEDYGDIFLSLAYFREKLDNIVPRVEAFLDEMRGMGNHFELQHDNRFQTAARYLDQNMNAVITSITGRFESFDRNSQDFWENLTPETFKKVRSLITGHHTSVGGVLCGLSVKMAGWQEKFGRTTGGRVHSRADFIMSSMRQGMEKIVEIEASAPKTADY